MSERGLRILTLDGGGMKGVVEVSILKKLLGDRNVHEEFDLIVGTSTGGLLTAMSGFLKKNLDDCLELYYNMGERVFPHSFLDCLKQNVHLLATLGTEGYRASVLETLIKECMGEDVLLNSQESITPKVALVSVISGTLEPFLFRNYDLEEHDPELDDANANPPYSGTNKAYLWQGCRATSAAPSYFEPLEIDNIQYLDGGVGNNNPTMIALNEARIIWPTRPIDLILSIGCGKSTKSVKKTNSIVNIGASILSLAVDTESNHQLTCERVKDLRCLHPNIRYFRLNPDTGIGDLDMASSSINELKFMEKTTLEWLDLEEQKLKLQKITQIINNPGWSTN